MPEMRTEPRAGARFCDACGSLIVVVDAPAEHKQVTVLFADVVRSMDLAAVLDSEQLREVMGDLFNSCGAVIQRYDGTVNQFTGDGIMALFGAPIALEDHAVRACVAALEIQREAAKLADAVQRRDGVMFALRVGLNSGDVVVGQIGTSSASYTAIGVHVGMAQRMESVAPPGGVMLSDATARLVEGVAVLDHPEMVTIKGVPDPVPARRLHSMAATRTLVGRRETTLVGRDCEIEEIAAMLNATIHGQGCAIGVTGPAGIGKSRVCRDVVKIAQSCGVETFSTYCESHASELPFGAVARLMRSFLRIEEFDHQTARSALRTKLAFADPEDVLLLEELRHPRPGCHQPNVAADARRRRLAALVNAAFTARETTAVYLVEDAHWIDAASESMLSDLATATLNQSMVVITFRPEYHGALAQLPGLRRFALGPLDDSAAWAMTAELVGTHPSVTEVAGHIIERSAGNPFYAQEIVREFVERRVIVGERGAIVGSENSPRSGCRQRCKQLSAHASID